MYAVSVKNEQGNVLNFYNNANYAIYKIDGLNPPPAALNFSEMANYDGSRYNSGRIENRNVVLYIKIYGDVETNRINLYKYFASKKLVRIYYENKTRNVYIDGRVETFEVDPFSENEVAQISMICDDPFWKEVNTTEIEFSNVVSLFEFPFAIEEEGIEFSRIDSLTVSTIVNGEIETGVIIDFEAKTSQILNPKIINRTNQTYFGVNYDMQQGDLIRINTLRAQKSVTLIRDGVETNIINHMQQGSTWITLEPGENEMSYECDNGASNLKVTVSAVKCYEGV